MGEEIEKNVAPLVELVTSYAGVMSGPVVGKREPINDVIQAKAVFEKAARKIDRSSPRKAPKLELEVEFLFSIITHLQSGRYENNEGMISLLCDAYLTVGHLTARLMRNLELSALGKLGARKRYAPMRELETWTLSEYRRGKWKSANQAAHALKDAVLAQSRTLEANLTESNAQRTIAEWINKDKKRSSG